VKEKTDIKQGSLDYVIGSNATTFLGFEEKLWKTVDKMRNNMDAGQYKHVVLGLIFLKYISEDIPIRSCLIV
jgi:type I restriction-modification system DNA methylase subunit